MLHILFLLSQQVKHGLHKLKRTSSCPSLDRPVPKVKKSSSAGSFLDVKCDSPFSPTENPTSFIFDLAMALACGDLNDPVKETETRSRAGSIAQLLTMALLPQTLDSGAPPETNLTRERSSTRRSLPPLQDFLLKNNNSTRTKYLPQNSVKHKKSVSLLEGLLFPPELAMNLKTPAKEVDNSKLRRSDRFIADATDGSLSGINKTKDNLSVGSKLSRSVSNPGTGTFRYTDRYMDNSTNNSFCNTYKSSHHHLEPVTEHGNHVSPKCNWIIGSPSADDVPSMALNNSEDEENPKQVYDNFDHNHHLTSQTLQRIPSSESQHIKLVPSISVIFRPETEMSTVIEEDNETSSQGSVTNLLNVENGSDQGISSQETVSIDITEPEPECQNEFTSTTDDDCQESGSICVASMESDLNDSTHM